MKGRDDARYLNLRLEIASPESQILIEDLAGKTWSKVRKPSNTHKRTCAALYGDLLKAADGDLARFSYRPMRKDAFTGQRIGYRAFKQVVDGSLAAGLIEVRTGTDIGVATRFRATKSMLALAVSYGVTPCTVSEHFRSIPRPLSIDEPLVLKSARYWHKSGTRMPFDPDQPSVKKLGGQVDEINRYMAGVLIEPDGGHFAFQRVFNEGDIPGRKFCSGGRLISMGASYQNGPKENRKDIRINGERTVELDIRASQLTILSARLGVPFDPHGPDPYRHPDIPRAVVKAWVTMTLGYDKFQAKWSDDANADYNRDHGGELEKDYPIAQVRDEALKLLPVLKDWPACPVRWGELQYLESCAVVDAVHTLATKHDIPALPVHDSIIVPVSGEVIARRVLETCFAHHIGVKPALKAAYGK